MLFATLAPLCAALARGVLPRAAMTLVCLLIAAGCDRFRLSAAPLDGSLSQGDFAVQAACALLALLLFGVWQRSARVWLSTIVPPPPHEHEHAHDVHGPHAH